MSDGVSGDARGGARFEVLLESYAELAVRVGVNLQPGQRLVVQATTDARELARRVAEVAYRAGARLVEVVWTDDGVRRARFAHASEESLDAVPVAHPAAFDAVAEEGGAVLYVRSSNPDLLAGLPAERMARAERAMATRLEGYNRARGEQRVNWSIIAAASPAWADRVFPELPAEERVAALWNAIFAATRVDREDPVAAWQEHLGGLRSAQMQLNQRRYRELRLRAPGTDLTVGLPEGHRWLSAEFERRDGLPYVANLPTEEVFTSPDAGRVSGTVRSSKPLVHEGSLIEGLGLRFEEGRVVEAWAERGEAVLRGILDADEGARRLGEIALVPHGSPISRSQRLFFDTLFDENAASHLALGFGFPFTLEGAGGSDEAAARGVNYSIVHVDFMVGSSAMDVDGVTAEGGTEAVMRAGEWAFGAGSR